MQTVTARYLLPAPVQRAMPHLSMMTSNLTTCVLLYITPIEDSWQASRTLMITPRSSMPL